MSALISLLLSTAAHAHGGFPESTALSFASPDAEVPTVLTTFGLLAQQSAGDWAWICEEVAGSNGISTFATLADGTWLLGTTSGLLVSADGCTWSSSAGLEGQYVTGLRVDRDDPDTVWVTTLVVDGSGALYRSTDAGQRFEVYASFGDGASLRGLLQGADGSWVVLGWLDETAWLWRSADGASWESTALDLAADHSVSLLGLDEAGTVWLRLADGQDYTLRRVEPDGSSADVAVFDFAILAFDLGPEPDELLISVEAAGLLRSADGGQSWSEGDETPTPKCLVSHGDRRYACTHNWSDDAAVMSAPFDEGDPAAMDWTGVLWFGDVHGVLECPAESTTALTCEPLWDTVSVSSGLDLERAPGDTGENAGDDKGRCGCATAGGARLWGAAGLALAMMLRRRVASRVPRR